MRTELLLQATYTAFLYGVCLAMYVIPYSIISPICLITTQTKKFIVATVALNPLSQVFVTTKLWFKLILLRNYQQSK